MTLLMQCQTPNINYTTFLLLLKMVNGNHDNNESNNANEGNGNNIPFRLKRTCESLTRRQRDIYNECATRAERIRFLEVLVEERKNQYEIGSELIGLVLYTLITGLIVLIYGLFFKNEESTKYFIVLLNSVYYIAKIVVLGTSMERLGIFYDNKVRAYTAIPIIVWTSLAILLGIFVISPVITVTFVNVGIEMAKLIVKFFV
ncbi:3238_t:CDS:2 [Funneliformis mosseae]|uniref:3238_t:CDS:1 n=1 Tax=Funneliformis mosseae TaxID=27381 RepID=A0A9N9BX82_FUNMO|nr:3238_t:CDS:2 [Funneliformis mosseae]